MPTQRKRETSSQCSCQGGPATCGKASTYNRHRCGCDPCVNSQRERVNANAAKRRAAAKAPQSTADAPAASTTSVTTGDAEVTPQKADKSPAKRELDFGPKIIPAREVWRPRGWKPLDRDFVVAEGKGKKR